MNYCIVGSELYLIQKKVNEILEAAGVKENDLNVVHFNASTKDFTIQEVIDDCNTLPFLEEKKVVLVRNPVFLSTLKSLSDKEASLLQAYLENSPKHCDLIFYGDITVDKRKKLVKLIQKQCRYHTMEKLSDQEFRNYVLTSIKERGIDLTSLANETLMKQLSNDLQAFHMELEKLSLYSGQLDEKIIEQLVTRPLDEDVFHLVNAVVQKNMKEAFTRWKDLQILNKDPIYLISILSSQFRLLYQVSVFLEMGMTQNEIQSELKVHPFRVTKAIEALRGLSKERCLFLLNELAICDQGFKNGTMDKNIGFELFLIKTAGR
ncbi:MAG: DNA polymerase III subunit delta [Anaerorhabdus sp.]